MASIIVSSPCLVSVDPIAGLGAGDGLSIGAEERSGSPRCVVSTRGLPTEVGPTNLSGLPTEVGPTKLSGLALPLTPLTPASHETLTPDP